MTQHDLEWADQLFPPMRVDMNQALIALSTRQAGSGAPALVAAARPNRLYVDITRKQVLARDNADTADFIWDSWAQDRCRLVTVGPDAFLPEDTNRLVMVNSPTPVAISLAQATGLFGPGWHSEVFNLGVGDVSIVPTVSTINGAAFVTMKQYQGAKTFSLGGQFWAALTGRGNATQDDLNAAAVPTGTLINHVNWTVAPAGYVRLQGGSIGSAASGGTERANADTQALYNLLWGLYTQAYLPVVGGRGASGPADFAANKYMVLFDARDRSIFAVGGTGRLTNSWGNGLNGGVPGMVGGLEYMQLGATHMAPHTHGYNSPSWYGQAGDGGPYAANTPSQVPANTDGGAGLAQTPFNIVPPGIVLGGWCLKL